MKLYGIQVESLYLLARILVLSGEGLMGKELSEKPDAIEKFNRISTLLFKECRRFTVDIL